MHVFLTGATGWIGSAITRELVAAGHQVTGLVRSADKAQSLIALGGTPLPGTLQDIDILKAGAAHADAVIHTAFGAGLGQPAVFARSAQEDRTAIETYGEVFRGSARPIVVTGGIGVLPRGQHFTEDTLPAPALTAFPRVSQQAAIALAERGLHAVTVRLPRSVHGAGETHGFIPRLMALARQHGFSAWIGDGENQWPSVHRLDAARLYRLAMEGSTGSTTFHAVAEEGIPFRQIAEAIGQRLGLPARSITPEEAATHFGLLAMPVAGHGPASSAPTRKRLGWVAQEAGIVADILQNYAVQQQAG